MMDRDGEMLAKLISFNHPHVQNPRLVTQGYEEACHRVIGSPMDEIVAAHLRVVQCIGQGDILGAYTAQTVLVQSFNKILQSQKDENWGIYVLNAITKDLRGIANSADQKLVTEGKGKPGDAMEKVAEILMSSFRICVGDIRAPKDVSKKWGTLPVVNQLFKVYFKINKINLMKPLIRAVEQAKLQDECKIGELVTYRSPYCVVCFVYLSYNSILSTGVCLLLHICDGKKGHPFMYVPVNRLVRALHGFRLRYFVGRKAIFDSDYKTAEENLSFAFERCHRSAKRNKRRILIYLIPVKLLLGQLPQRFILEKYSLLEFAGIADTLRCGNILALNDCIDRNEKFFIQCGTYLILEKLAVIAYRNLFKRVYLILGTHQMPLSAFCDALKFLQVEDIDNEETQCLVANLIDKSYIRGYISHQHQKLVVSKQTAFPLITSDIVLK